MILYCVRHGESTYNVEGRIRILSLNRVGHLRHVGRGTKGDLTVSAGVGWH